MAWGVQSGEALYHTTCSTHYPGLVGQTTDIFKFKFHLDLHNTKQQSLGYKPPWTVSSGCFNWQVDTCRSQLLSLRIRMSALDLPTLSVVFLMEESNTERDLHVAVRVCGYNNLATIACWSYLYTWSGRGLQKTFSGSSHCNRKVWTQRALLSNKILYFDT